MIRKFIRDINEMDSVLSDKFVKAHLSQKLDFEMLNIEDKHFDKIRFIR